MVEGRSRRTHGSRAHNAYGLSWRLSLMEAKGKFCMPKFDIKKYNKILAIKLCRGIADFLVVKRFSFLSNLFLIQF